MRYIIMHKTDAASEADVRPSPELIARVNAMIGEMAEEHALLAGEGLRPSSLGVRVRFTGDTREVIQGPLRGEHELPAGLSILRVGSLDEAVEWAARHAQIVGDGEVDIRPVTEPWDLGVAPPPADTTTRRVMVVRKATAATEAGVQTSPEQRARLTRLLDETTRAGVHLGSETLQPSARGRRYKNSRDGITAIDGPFSESKEMVGGYVIITASSLDHAARWAPRYIEAVGITEVDVRPLEDAQT